jgi:hypothetical protein
VSIGAVLDEAWTLFTRFFLRFFVIGLIVFAAVNLLYALVVTAIDADDGGAAFGLAIVGLATAVIGTTWLQGAFVYAVQDARDGSFDATLGEVFSRVAPSIVPLLVAGLLAGLGIALGLLLLIVPGLFLLTIWAVIAPVIVVEKQPPFGAFGRSRELVRGHGWTVFGIVLITGLLTGIASGILQAAFSFLPRFFEILVGGTIAQAVVAPFSAIALAITYFRLREAHGAVEPAAPAEA